MMAAGYNAMTAVMVIVLGAGSGVLGSTLNPFSTGIAAKSAGVELDKVLGVQAIIWLLCWLRRLCLRCATPRKVKKGNYKDDVRCH